MNRRFWTLRLTVKDGERAILLRDGRFERVLEPGRHRIFDPMRELTADVYPVVRTEFPLERFNVLKAARPDLASALFAEVEMKSGELAVVSFDGRPVHLVGPWTTRVFWKVATKVDVERIDVARDPKVDPRHLAMVSRTANSYLTEPVIENHEAGLLYIEGRFVERLAPGRHSFWTVDRKIEVKRPRPAAAGGRDHRAGDADEGPHLAACDAHRAAPGR